MHVRKSIVAFLVACGVHAILLAALWARAPGDRRTWRTNTEPQPETTVWLDLEQAAEGGHPALRVPDGPLGQSGAPRAFAARLRAGQLTPTARSELGRGTSTEEVEARAADGASASSSDIPVGAEPAPFRFQATRSGVGAAGDAALGQARAVGQGLQKVAEERDPARLSQIMHDADVARGFGRGGAIARAIESGVREDVAGAPLGTARFEVRLSSDGSVDVRLVTSSDRAAFSGVARRLVSRLQGEKPQARGTASFIVTVDVDVHDQYADGTRPADVGKVSASVSPGEVAQAADGTLVLKKLPGVSASVRGKVCSAGVYAHPLGVGFAGGCSPENIGQVARRLVSARVVKEELN